MILESTPESSSKLDPRNDENREPLTEPEGPPAYVSEAAPLLAPTGMKPGKSHVKRFIKAFILAAFIFWILVGATSRIVWYLRGAGRHSQKQRPKNDVFGSPSPSDGVVHKCVGGRDWQSNPPNEYGPFPLHSNTTFELPLSDTHYFFSRGELSFGEINVVASDSDSDQIRVEVSASYYSQEALDRASVCSMERKKGQHGLGIFTPTIWGDVAYQVDLVLFQVKVHLPTRHAPLYIENFETDFKLFYHAIGDFTNVVDFGRLSLHSWLGPIVVESVSAAHILVETSKEAIEGSFNASKSLELRTDLASITAQINLSNDPLGEATNLSMITNDALINSTISLTSLDINGGSFNVNTTTSNSPIQIIYDTSPMESTLKHHSETTQSPVTVKLSSAYEGSFTLRTSLELSRVEKKNIEDPRGMDRGRVVNIIQLGTAFMAGDVYWRELINFSKEVTRGHIEIRTSHSPAHLYV